MVAFLGAELGADISVSSGVGGAPSGGFVFIGDWGSPAGPELAVYDGGTPSAGGDELLDFGGVT